MGPLDIADRLGLTVETVSRTMTELRGAGVISLPSPNRALVLRPATLGKLAGEAGSGPRRRRGRASRRRA